MDIAAKLAQNAKEFPEKPAVIFKDKITTFKDLNNRAARFANAITSLGLKPKQKVAAIMRNRAEYLEVIYGLTKAGLVHVPVNWRFGSEEMRHVITNSESVAVVVAAEFCEKLDSIMDELTNVDKNAYILLDGDSQSGMHAYEDLLAKASDSEPGVDNQAGDAFFIGYTSGTTGFPKGAITPHGDWDSKPALLCGLLRLGDDDVQLLTMPLFHMNAINTASMSHYVGHTVVVMERFRAEEALRLIQEHKASFSSMVPTMYHRLKNLSKDAFDKYDTSSMKSLLQSSAPLPFPTKEWIIKSFPSAGLHEAYGGTEVGVVTYMPPEEQLNRPGSVGIGLPTVEIKLVDDDGNEVPQGQVGQFISRPAVKVPGTVTEYYKDEKSTGKSFKGGWFYSGDMARKDADGFYYLVDRKFDMIISGGENIYPAEIEAVLYKHPKLLESAIIGVPDDEWGESVKAVVVLREGETATEEEIIAYCRETLAGYMIPRSVDFIDELPKTDTGKILKKIIKKPFWEGRDTNII